jgi:hypothetical protein
VLDIVVNAAHAIEELVKGTEKRGFISVKTSVEGELVVDKHSSHPALPAYQG